MEVIVQEHQDGADKEAQEHQDGAGMEALEQDEVDMKALARELQCGIDLICGTYYYRKDEEILLKALGMAERIRRFCGVFLQGNIFGIEESEYQDLQKYVYQALEDFLEAVEQKDAIYMLDTLDYGLRELVNIYMEEEDEPGNI